MFGAHRPKVRRRSFSLLEMVIALAVLGSGVVGIAQALSQSLESNRRVEQRDAALDLLRLKMAEYASTARALETQEGKFDAPFQGYDWKVEIKPTELSGLFRLDVEVSWRGRKVRRSLTAETLVPQR